MLLPWFEWCGQTLIGAAIRDSPGLFPLIEFVHLVALAVIGGAVLVVDLRLLGFAPRRQPVAKVAQTAEPWLLGSLLCLLITGALLFTSEAVELYYSGAFWTKMRFLLVAILFTFTIRRRVARGPETGMEPLLRRLVALISLTLWLGVALAGRWNAFFERLAGGA